MIFAIILNFSMLSFAQNDTLVLSYDEYINYVVNHHPLFENANLKLEQGEATIIAAKGNFDPVLSSNFKEKNLSDDLYYRQFEGKLVYPTPLGIDVVAGYQNNSGVYLNPENRTDDFGLWNVGLEINVLQGLWINERRTQLRQARIFNEMAANERAIAINDLLYNAITAYINWQQYEEIQEALNENIAISETYYLNTTESFLGGEKTGMDTLEAYILYQDAIIFAQKNELNLRKARVNASNFLWQGDQPVLIASGVIPSELDELDLPLPNFDISTIDQNHPVIQAAINKLSYLEVERRLKKEKFKPKLKLKFNPLLTTMDDSVVPTYSTNDYKWGIDFSMPLYYRSERGNLQLSQIKIETAQNELANKRNELVNKSTNSLQLQEILRDQIVLLEQNVERYALLLAGEEEKFLFGESSVFLLNKRQEKFFQSQIKLIETKAKLESEKLYYLYLTNTLYQE